MSSSNNKHVPNVLTPFEAPYATHAQRAAYADGLRALADWVESSRFPIPTLCFDKSDYIDATLNIHSLWIDDENFIRRPGSAARLIGGKVDKSTSVYGGSFTLTRDFGGGARMRYQIMREAVCEAKEVVVDEEHLVPVDEIVAVGIKDEMKRLQKQLDELPKELRTVPVNKTVYSCPDSLLSDEKIEKPVAVAIDLDDVPF